MPLLLLCGVTAYSRKRRYADVQLGEDAPGPGGRRWERMHLPQPEWFLELCKVHNVTNCLHTHSKGTLDRRSDCTVAGSCLVSVAPRSEYRGPLTPWSKEEFLMWRALDQPYDAFSVRVIGVVLLEPPVRVEAGQRIKTMVWNVKVPLPVGDFRGYVPSADGAPLRRLASLEEVQEMLRVSRQELESFAASPTCMQVFDPFLIFIKRGLMPYLLLRASWARTSRMALHPVIQALGFPRDSWIEGLRASGRLEKFVHTRSRGFFDPIQAAGFAEQLRSWAPMILDASGEEEGPQAIMILEQAVLRLDELSNREKFGDSACLLGRNKAIKPEQIIRALTAAMHLKNRGTLRETVAKGIAASDRAFDVDITKAQLASGSTISRHQVIVDAALCCIWRDIFRQHDGPIYVFADSSPQAGTDWLLSIVMLIRADDLQECVSSANVLESSVERFRLAVAAKDTDEMLAIAAQRNEACLQLAKKMRLHRQIPMGLGSGCTSLDHKCRCLVRKFYAEAQTMGDTERVQQMVRGFCTDLGTEMGLPDVEVATADVVPDWMVDPLQSDGAVECEELDEHQKNFLYPNAVLSPGILHINDNMCQEINKMLLWWVFFFTGFKALAHLLHHDHLRQRFVGTCILGIAHAWMKDFFKSGVPNPALWRWGSIVATLKKILPLKAALRRTWNERLFSGQDQGRRTYCE